MYDPLATKLFEKPEFHVLFFYFIFIKEVVKPPLTLHNPSSLAQRQHLDNLDSSTVL